MPWQLRKKSTNEILQKRLELPENWGPIFGLSGVQDRLDDLSWLGENYADYTWEEFEGSVEDTAIKPSSLIFSESQIIKALEASSWVESSTDITVEDKIKWLDYREKLNAVRYQPGYPDNIEWPKVPQ